MYWTASRVCLTLPARRPFHDRRRPHDEDIVESHCRDRDVGIACLEPAGARAGRRATAGDRALRHVVQSAGPAAVRSRDALSTFLLVSRVPGGVRASAPGRSAVRHGLLGDRAQHAPEPARPDAEGQPRTRPGHVAEGHGPARCRHRASGTTSRPCSRSTPITTRWRMARACSATSRRWLPWRSAIPMTTRRRSAMPSPSALPRPPTTRPTRTSSRAPPSWSRSSGASRATPASPTT